MDLKNITMDDLKQKLAAVDKKTLIKFGSGFGAIILFLIIYYVILNPMVKERKAKYNDKIVKQNEIQETLKNYNSLFFFSLYLVFRIHLLNFLFTFFHFF